MKKKVLGIIPARGGSKGIPKKNLQEIAGKPLVAYPITEAKRSEFITELVVSTDSTELASYLDNLGQKYILRPNEIAQDQSPVIETVFHVLEVLKKEGKEFDLVILLQPTSPFWKGAQLDEVIGLFEDDAIEGVVSVVPSTESHPARMYDKESNDFLKPLIADAETLRRQDLSPVYSRNGCFYAVKTSALYKHNSLMPPVKKGYVMDPYWCLTIDTPRDLLLARFMAEEWNSLES
ncbi:acylneuraminate cytidylyltransferase family protein [Algoriphagus sp. AGSA1]|uniref:acylneuraminate cytidylyltransferase family protein n=1 Tax=Algoriphagus sp. AGSA1 TaxID=2907213 RepID=UPI001F3BCBA8|nr:acylneuraminate cytidylyltransferase family protein [Algoriphagus sp. AGSA1]MCE7055286.1 acylneuraminate cytidylyltransferase family protein [Algoriphagus sp. AGSA1]